MPQRVKTGIGIALAVVVAGAVGVAAARDDSGGGGTVRVGAVAPGQGASNQRPPVSAEDRQRASESALQHTGGGQVTEIDMEAGDSLYEVEVQTPDRGEVEVYVGRDFKVVGEEADDDDHELDDADDDCDDD